MTTTNEQLLSEIQRNLELVRRLRLDHADDHRDVVAALALTKLDSILVGVERLADLVVVDPNRGVVEAMGSLRDALRGLRRLDGPGGALEPGEPVDGGALDREAPGRAILVFGHPDAASTYLRALLHVVGLRVHGEAVEGVVTAGARLDPSGFRATWHAVRHPWYTVVAGTEPPPSRLVGPWGELRDVDSLLGGREWPLRWEPRARAAYSWVLWNRVGRHLVRRARALGRMSRWFQVEEAGRWIEEVCLTQGLDWNRHLRWRCGALAYRDGPSERPTDAWDAVETAVRPSAPDVYDLLRAEASALGYP